MTTCRCESCSPGSTGPTFSQAYRIECEARTILSWDVEARREFLKEAEKKRGAASVEVLKAEIIRQHELRKASA